MLTPMEIVPLNSRSRHVERMVRRVDGVVRRLLEPLFNPQPAANGWKMISWDAEQGISLVFGKDGRFILIELEARDEHLDCYARTAKFNVCARAQFAADPDLSDAERLLVDAVVRLVQRRESLVEIDSGVPKKRSEVREILIDRMLVDEGDGHYYLNAYAGCMLLCSFCYVAPRAEMSRRLDGSPPPSTGRWVDVKVNAREVLEREVKTRNAGTVRMSPILTDPYQPIEKLYRITRQCLEVLMPAGFPPVILTRESRMLEDLPLLASGPSAVGFSIPTDDDRLRVAFEPGADSIEHRLAALRKCSEAGVLTYLVVQPALPMLDVNAFVDRTAPWTKVVRIDGMHFKERVASQYRAAGIEYATSPAWEQDLLGRLREAYGKAGVRIDEHDNMSGILHDMLTPKSGWKRATPEPPGSP